MTILASDDTLIKLNEEIEQALLLYISDGVLIRFDLPQKDEQPDVPTISVFLYDIQEDLQLRHGENRSFDSASGKLLPGYVNVRCCYLITYWDTDSSNGGDSPSARASSQTLQIINNVMNALINKRTFPKLPGSYSRIIPPSEHLNSLGNFWQSLDNRPRVCLSYSVTIPVRLTDPKLVIAAVESVQAIVEKNNSKSGYI